MFDAFMGIDQDNWSAFGNLVARRAAALVALLVVGLVVNWMLHRLIDRLVKRAEEGVLPDRLTNGKLGRSTTEPPPGSTRRVQRAKTMGSLLKSITTGLIVGIVVTMMLAEIGLDIGPIVASAGIVGVALGFGSQTLVKDFLSGIFMIFEDQYGVGDVVDMGEGLTGTVEAVSLRVTRMRDTNGTVWYVRNGELLRVGNMSQNWARTVLDVQVSSREDLTRVKTRARRRPPRPLAGRRLRGRDHRGARDLGHRGDHAGRDHAAGHAQDRADGAVAGRPGAARAAQEPLRPRGHPGALPHVVRDEPDVRRGPGDRRRRRPERRLTGPTGENGAVSSTFYDEIGGEETITRVVAAFYRGVADDEVLRPLYPEEDLGPAEERFRLFLMQYWGGPTTYSEERGHPRLRMRHAPFAVTPVAKDHWLACFRAALDEVALPPEQDAQFWDYVTHAAQFMVNSFE